MAKDDVAKAVEKRRDDALRRAPGISLLDRRDDGGYASPAEIVGDDVRLGAALNAARLAEAVLKA
jgi:hypothetical protein